MLNLGAARYNTHEFRLRYAGGFADVSGSNEPNNGRIAWPVMPAFAMQYSVPFCLVNEPWDDTAGNTIPYSLSSPSSS